MYYHQGSQQFPVVIMLQTINDNPALVQSQSTFATFRSNADGTQSIAVIKQKIQVFKNLETRHYTLNNRFGRGRYRRKEAPNPKP